MKAALLFASLAAAAPSALESRAVATLCDQYGYWSGNGYEANNNMWGKGSASSGSACTYIDSASSGSVTFRNEWTWQGGQNNVKAYPYVGKIVTKGRKISSIGSMQTNVNWNYQGNNLRANVAYDIFTAADPNHDRSSGDYELMIWLARLGDVYPIGSKVNSVNVAGKQWDLYSGYNGGMKVFSFVAQQTTNSWGGDVKAFYNYLQQNQGYPADQQNLIVFQFGSEPFTGGPATFTATFSANF